MRNHNLPPTPRNDNDVDAESNEFDLDGAFHISDGESLTTYFLGGAILSQLFVDPVENDLLGDEESNKTL